MDSIFFLVAFLLGLMACFAGYRLFKFFLTIAGAVSGGGAGWFIAHAAGAGGGVALIAVVIGAILGGALAVALFYAGVFLLGASAFMGVGYMISGSATVALIIAAIGGILCIILQKYMIIIATAYGGAAAVGRVVEATTVRFGHAAIVLGVVILGTIGLFAQIGLLARDRRFQG